MSSVPGQVPGRDHCFSIGPVSCELDPEHGVISRVREGGEELAGPPTHVLAIGGHDPVVLVALDLDRPERLVRPAPPQLALAGRPQVAHPVGLAAARDEVPSALELERGDGRPDRAARCAGRER